MLEVDTMQNTVGVILMVTGMMRMFFFFDRGHLKGRHSEGLNKQQLWKKNDESHHNDMSLRHEGSCNKLQVVGPV